MEIIWGKNEKGKELDLILDVTLRAVIVRDGSKAYVVTADNKRTNDSIIQSQDVESIDFIFSPDRALNSLEYVLLSDKEQEGYEELIGEFQDAFYEEIKRQAEEANKQGDLLRAHQLIFTWEKFNRKGVTINLPTTPSVEVEDEVTKIKGNSSKKMRECLTELIIKYTLYIAVWEKAYSMNDVARVITKNFSKYERIIRKAFTDGYRVPRVARSKQIEDVWKETDEDEREIARELYEEIQQTIQNYSGLDSSKMNFFYKNPKKREEKNHTLYQTVRIAKITDVSQYMDSTREDFKKILFDELVKEKANYSVRLRMCDLLQLGTEIVVFNVIRFNENIFYKGNNIAYSKGMREQDDYDEFFFNYANVMHFQMIPYLNLRSYASKHENNEKNLEPYKDIYKETAAYFKSDKTFDLLDRSNWGENKNKARKYLRVRNSYFVNKGICTYTEEKSKNALTYNKKAKRFEFSDKNKKQIVNMYYKFILVTERTISKKLKGEIHKLAQNV